MNTLKKQKKQFLKEAIGPQMSGKRDWGRELSSLKAKYDTLLPKGPGPSYKPGYGPTLPKELYPKLLKKPLLKKLQMKPMKQFEQKRLPS